MRVCRRWRWIAVHGHEAAIVRNTFVECDEDAGLFRQLGVTCARTKSATCDIGLNNCQRHEDCVVAKSKTTLVCKDEWVSAYAGGGGPYCCAYCEKRSSTACGTCQVLGLRDACPR